MRTVSKNQGKKNGILARIKKTLPKQCHISGLPGNDLAHVIPKSVFPEYYCEEWNLIILERSVHQLYDGDRDFRRKQTDLYMRALSNVKPEDRGRVSKYFGRI